MAIERRLLMISIRFFHLAKVTIHTLLICIILYSCNLGTSSKNETAKNKDSAATQTAIKINTHANPNQRILASNITPHFFSNHTQKDTFKLILSGDSLYTATAIFTIISYKGERIYDDIFPSTDLFDKSDTFPPSVANIESGIKIRIKSFFENNAFIDTAESMLHTDVQGYVSDTVFSKELESDKTIIGFQYSIGEEDDQCIAYSKKQHKVLAYWGVGGLANINNAN